MAKNRQRTEGEESHPAAFLGGSAAGAIAGAAVGTVGGPAGIVAGATIGGFAGAKTGEMLAMPEEHEAYWRDNYKSRPYAKEGSKYDDYAPAYRTGYKAYCEWGDSGKSFDDVEDTARQYYDRDDTARLDWEQARDAARDSFERTSQFGSSSDDLTEEDYDSELSDEFDDTDDASIRTRGTTNQNNLSGNRRS